MNLFKPKKHRHPDKPHQHQGDGGGSGSSSMVDATAEDGGVEVDYSSVANYVLDRLSALGVRHVFTVPGDFAFPLDAALTAHRRIAYIGCCNELNAAYAADGYARLNGVAALCTTFGVGELSAMNGVAGAYSERLAVFHLVGMPELSSQREGALLHHTLGNGQFDLFYHMAQPVVCARTILTAENVIGEMDRVIECALYERRPAYIAVPRDEAKKAVVRSNNAAWLDSGCTRLRRSSDPDKLKAAVRTTMAWLRNAESACVLAGVLLGRFSARREALQVIETSRLPFATMFMGKCVIEETHPQFIGVYDGRLLNEKTREIVECGDVILALGSVFSDFNTGAFTAHLEQSRLILARSDCVEIGHAVYTDVLLREYCAALADALREELGTGEHATPLRAAPSAIAKHHGVRLDQLPESACKDDAEISVHYFMARLQSSFLREDDVVIGETSATGAKALVEVQFPRGATFFNQTLWGSIGHATGCALGTALACSARRQRRTVLVTGEGSHQMTANELGTFARYGLTPAIFVVNNDGYLIERMLSGEPDNPYNDIAQWDYVKLPEALGCKRWCVRRATTVAELNEALREADACYGTRACYVEVVMPRMSAPTLLERFVQAQREQAEAKATQQQSSSS